ncbi:hypothetical protein [Photorhabdus viridis]|uniref:hypothetical protein n=1 Tax=Photorhabdus viridis TaxID=3163327 RepID=UPI003306D223
MIKIATGLAAITIVSLSHATFASSLPQEKEIADKEKPKNILKIDDFLPEKKKWTLSTGISILNKSGSGSSQSFYLNEISPGHYILNSGTQTYQKETNGVSAHSSLIYGITNELAVGATVNGQWQNTQYTFDDGKKAVNEKYQFNGV